MSGGGVCFREDSGFQCAHEKGLMKHGWMDRWTEGWMDRWIDERMDG